MDNLPSHTDSSRRKIKRRRALSLTLSALATGLVASCGPGVVTGTRRPPSAIGGARTGESVQLGALTGTWKVVMTRPTSVGVSGAIFGRIRAVLLEFKSGNTVCGWAFHLPAQAGEQAPKVRGTSVRIPSARIVPRDGGSASLSRPAGTFVLTGFDGTTTTGPLAFTPDTSFVAAHASLGVDLSPQQVLALAFSGAAIGDYQELHSSFPDVTIADLAMIGLFGQSVRDASRLKRLVPTITASDLPGFLLRQITPEYVQSLHDAGRHDLSPSDIKRVRDAVGEANAEL